MGRYLRCICLFLALGISEGGKYLRELNGTVKLEGGKFVVGVKDSTSMTGEYPPREVTVKPFEIDIYPVTNYQYLHFIAQKKKVEPLAKKRGWGYVFKENVMEDPNRIKDLRSIPSLPWWTPIRNASWDHPEGPESSLAGRMDHPVVQVTFHEAMMYCKWKGKRLPSETEWEYAARGGLRSKAFPWGDHYKPNRMNTWQGSFPTKNTVSDGYYTTSPVDAFPPQNEFELYDMVGNVWEWTDTLYDTRGDRHHDRISQGKGHKQVLKGGSFLDIRDGLHGLEDSVLTLPVRCASRLGMYPDVTTNSIGFRCAKLTPKKVESTPAPTGPRFHKLSETFEYKEKKRLEEKLRFKLDGEDFFDFNFDDADLLSFSKHNLTLRTKRDEL